MKIFLSYPRKDGDKARQLRDALFQGGHSVWMDAQLVTGQAWQTQLEDQIRAADAIALALTPHWVASPYCNWEFVTAVENGKKVIPVLLEKTDLPERISRYQYADLSAGFYEDKVQKLLNDLVTLATTVDRAAIADLDKAAFAREIASGIRVQGNDNIVGDGNTVTRTGNISVGGNINAGNLNLGGTQTFHGDVTINTSGLGALPASDSRQELKQALEQLEAALQQEAEATSDADQIKNIKRVRKHANEIAAEAAKDEPDKDDLEISGEDLEKAAKNLLRVAPIAARIGAILTGVG